jgi:hypothetical protein
MTAQIHDSIVLQDKKFSIVGVHGNELFNPVDFELHPFSTVTSCWRGYVCTYKIFHNKLLLATLEVNLHQQGPTINGVEPLLSAGMFNHTYSAMNLQIQFTGEIFAGDKFIRELYVHMGFHPAWKYETVYELVISNGSVLNTKDVSKQMAQLREQMIRQPLDPPKNRDWMAK